MKTIRPNVFYITYSELGKPAEKGLYDVEGLGKVGLDEADIRYIEDFLKRGYEPAFFVSASAPMGGRFVVVSRQRAA